MNKFDLDTIFIFSIILGLLVSIVGVTFNLYFIAIIGVIIIFLSIILSIFNDYND